jgi:hypothetical protein
MFGFLWQAPQRVVKAVDSFNINPIRNRSAENGCVCGAGWPDVFVKKYPKWSPKHFCKNLYVHSGKKLYKICATYVIRKQCKHSPNRRNSPKLVTLQVRLMLPWCRSFPEKNGMKLVRSVLSDTLDMLNKFRFRHIFAVFLNWTEIDQGC